MGDVEQACRDSIGVTFDKAREIFCSSKGGDFDFDSYREDVRAELRKKDYDLKPGVYELFDWLEANGVPTALASSTRYATVSGMLDKAELTEHFSAIVCGDMVTHSKPHPEIFLTAAERLGAPAADCWVIEDSYNGIRAAHNAGMHPLMVPDVLQPDDEMLELADAVLPSLIEVKDYLDNIRFEEVKK